MKELTRQEGRGNLNNWCVKRSCVNLLQCKKKNERKGDKMRERIEEKRRGWGEERRRTEWRGQGKEEKEENEKKREENSQIQNLQC